MQAEEVWALALALPGATEAPHFAATSFRVRGRIFATVPPEHTHVHVFLPDADADAAIAADPGTVEVLPWGTRRAGVRVAIAPMDGDRMGALLEAAWRQRAGRR